MPRAALALGRPLSHSRCCCRRVDFFLTSTVLPVVVPAPLLTLPSSLLYPFLSLPMLCTGSWNSFLDCALRRAASRDGGSGETGAALCDCHLRVLMRTRCTVMADVAICSLQLDLPAMNLERILNHSLQCSPFLMSVDR